MAKATLQLFPYVHLNKDGKLSHIGAHTWRYVDKGDCPDGCIDKDSGNITVYLPPFNVEFTGPDDVREQALRILRFHRDKLTAEHINTMTKFQWTEGMLLGLAAPEVLDAADDGPGMQARGASNPEVEDALIREYDARPDNDARDPDDIPF